MATEPLAQGQPRPGARGYETKDANVPWIFGIVLVLACSGVVTHLTLAGFLRHLIRGGMPTDAWTAGHGLSQSVPQGAFPRLQVSARLDLTQFHAREDEELTNYGWVNRSAGIVRIPIEKAMDLVLRKGLPVRTNEAASVGLSPAQLIEKRTTRDNAQRDHK